MVISTRTFVSSQVEKTSRELLNAIFKRRMIFLETQFHEMSSVKIILHIRYIPQSTKELLNLQPKKQEFILIKIIR